MRVSRLAVGGQFVGREVDVRARRRVGDQRLGSAQRRCHLSEADRLHEAAAAVDPADHVEGEQAAAHGHLPFGQVELRVGGQARVPHLGDLWVVGQPSTFLFCLDDIVRTGL